ncbi:hypothetical protein PAXRUDRAFT_827049 [Paxillus rubicundulus Ve08.2h10]|uniref:F-box domain-containing protein n=1 Tax=Paxillus rubicundulus Ve08.2h10 TaxID=930991 RepID=A0A0D0DRA6_9AGAM|nr:hypothetical protein PAXRUDRAFT_827049 [Paxillus rubicundulus Ve08.2h10]
MSLPITDLELSFNVLNAIPHEIQRLVSNSEPIVPTEAQEHVIISTLRSLRKKLEHALLHTAKGYDELRTSAAYSKNSVDRLQVLVQRLAVLRSPVKRLPSEILTLIFDLCVVRGSDPLPVSAQGPLYLARVCRTWRDNAHSYPFLWTYINFYFSEACDDRVKDISRVGPAIDMWLERSSTLPISLTFTDLRIHDLATDDLVHLLVDRLRNNSRRWKSLSLQLSCRYSPLLFHFTPCDLTSLEHLSITGYILEQRIVNVTTPHLDLTSATNLKSLAYSGPGQSPGGGTIDVDWDRLSEVSFEFNPHAGASFTVSRQLKQLSQCHNITTCSLGVSLPVRFGSSDQQRITLSCLRTLCVRRLAPRSHACSVINPLVLPQLQTLTIDAAVLVGWNVRWHDRNFSNLLARSSCSLESLHIKDVYFPNEELFRCLAHSRELKSLCFLPCPRSQDILDIIETLDVSRSVSGGPVVSHLLPRLQELKLACTRDSCLEGIMGMLLSRVGARAHAAGVDALRRFELVFFDLWHESLDARSVRLARLDSFRESSRQCAADNENLEVSFVVEAPYMPEYIEVD